MHILNSLKFIRRHLICFIFHLFMLIFDGVALLHAQKKKKNRPKDLTFRGQVLTSGFFTYCSNYNSKNDFQHHFRFTSLVSLCY